MTGKRLVVSAVNLNEGGPLTVLINCLESAARSLGAEWEIVALVHKRGLVTNPRIRCLAFPESKRSWVRRLQLEWVQFSKLSQELKPDLWLSLHDITPRIQARRQAVYCHNASPFYRLSLLEAFLEPKLLLFNSVYAFLYRINIGRNYAVIVQQEWLRTAFRRLYAHPNVVVAHPTTLESIQEIEPQLKKTGKSVFLYPALPRVFKNFEVVCDAVATLPENIQAKIEIRLTLDGTENRYARDLVRRYANVLAIRFIGRKSREAMDLLYRECDAVLFPSKLETWGLPISEAKAYGKCLLVADLPYAHETVGNYDKVKFITASNSFAWANAIQSVVIKDFQPSIVTYTKPAPPFAENWEQLWQILTTGL